MEREILKMIYPTIKAHYTNDYAGLLISDNIMLCDNKFLLIFILNKDNIIYDCIILPPAKYKQTKQVFTIYHTDDTPEVFYRVDTCTP